MIEKVEGFIISETNYSESSKIINILTKDYGIIGVIAKGAKKIKSPFRTTTTRFSYGSFNLYYKPGKLSVLISADIINDFRYLRSDIVLMGYLNYLTELIMQVVKQNNDEIVSLYDLFINTLLKIEAGLDPAIMSNIFELKMLDYLGVGINFNACIRCGNQTDIVTIDGDAGGLLCNSCRDQERIVEAKTLKMIRLYYYVDIKTISELNISSQVSQEINNFINTYIKRYTGLYIHSKDFLQKLTAL